MGGGCAAAWRCAVRRLAVVLVLASVLLLLVVTIYRRRHGNRQRCGAGGSGCGFTAAAGER